MNEPIDDGDFQSFNPKKTKDIKAQVKQMKSPDESEEESYYDEEEDPQQKIG